MTILINTTPVVEFNPFQSGKLFLHLLQSKVDLHVLASLTFHDMKNSSLPPFSEEGTWHNWLFGNLVNMKKDELGVDLTKVAPKLHFLYCGFIFLATAEHKCPTTFICNNSSFRNFSDLEQAFDLSNLLSVAHNSINQRQQGKPRSRKWSNPNRRSVCFGSSAPQK